MRLTDWIVAIAAIFQAGFAGLIWWLTRRYVGMQSDLVNLQKSLTTLQDTIVNWQTRIQVEPRLYFEVGDKHEVPEIGIVRLRVGNLSAIGVWLKSVEIQIVETATRRNLHVIQVEDLLPPDTSREIDIWTRIEEYARQNDISASEVLVMNVKVVVTCLANNKPLILMQECRFHYVWKQARHFEIVAE